MFDPPGTTAADGLDARTAARWMLLLREIDAALLALVADRSDEVLNGTVLHPYTGLEPLATGIGLARRDGDAVFGSHRGLAYCLAWGLDPVAILAEVLGRRTGTALGRGGHMHVIAPEAGVGGTNGIVGAGMPLACGAALALRNRRRGAVVFSCFGDGATNTGAFHESLNLATVWKLPVVFVCEDNGITEAMHSAEVTAGTGLADRAAAYGMPVHDIDGDDVAAVHAAATAAIAHASAGEGPVFIHADVTRTRGHWSGDRQHYRDAEDVTSRASHDPVAAAVAGLEDADALITEARERAQDLVRQALAAPPPDRATLVTEDGR